MSWFWDLLAFAGIMALGQFSPGPDMVLLTRTALAEGARRGVAMATGIGTGLTIHAALAIGGTAAIFDQPGLLRDILRWLAACYLIWIAYQIVRSIKGVAGDEADEQSAGSARTGSGRGAFVRGFLCNMLNPKVVLFFAAIVAPFLRGDREPWWPWALWSVIVVQGVTLWSIWALVLQWRPVTAIYKKAGKWIDLIFAALLAALAIRLAVG